MSNLAVYIQNNELVIYMLKYHVFQDILSVVEFYSLKEALGKHNSYDLFLNKRSMTDMKMHFGVVIVLRCWGGD